MEVIKLDLHVHSAYSEDAKGKPKDIIKAIKNRKLNGLAITDHNTVRGSLEALEYSSDDFLVIPGIEVSTSDGHIIALGIKKDIPKGKSVEETIDMILEEGGIPIVPHLYRAMSGIKKRKLIGIRNKIGSIEVFNSCSMSRTNEKMSKTARELKLGGTGGSDAHNPEFAGYGYTLIEDTDLDTDSILTHIEKGKAWGYGKVLPLRARRKRVLLSVKQFFDRKFKRI